jgi:hypothetical protein
VGVRERRQRAGFALEAQPRGAVPGSVGAQHLHGDQLAAFDVARLVDDAERPRTDDGAHLVALADQRAWRENGRSILTRG